MKSTLPFLALTGCSLLLSPSADACTGITLKSKDGATIVARTIEWGGSDLNSHYVVVPRGYTQSSYIPDGTKNGMTFTARYGFVGIAVEQEEFVAEGLNEAGLSAGLFYFPRTGQYKDYVLSEKDKSISDLQLVSWILGECATVDQVKAALENVRVIAIDPRASTVHWRFADTSGRQIVLEIIGGEVRFYDNPLGVLTNSPELPLALDQPEQLRQSVSRVGSQPAFGCDRIELPGSRKRLFGHPGRHHSAFPFCPGCFLPGYRSPAADCPQNGVAGPSDPQ